ncbi:sugar ABC transporter ATP-binding protein [Actinomyces culturomici]|uniref:sugar ABC transporter ATP-binding protein n=1 Tax=Actinomyces culturomici TaxID=1926276 RepID=UPI00135C496B|nr:sugar ABC transporter ATP-binding protein [Actinomyces culturomici]
MNEHASRTPLLDVEGLTVRFPGVLALDSVSLTLRPGECHALVGENGAGKSTLARCIIGECRPSSGTIKIRGTEVHDGYDVRKSQELGVAIVHQEFQLMDELSGIENICMGHFEMVGPFISKRRQRAEVAELVSRLGIDIDLNVPVKRLRTAEKQIVQLLRALALDANVIILDELTAVLPETDVARVFEIVRLLKEQGKGIIYISHRLDEIFEICDSYTVLMDGRFIERGEVRSLTKPRLVELIAGRELGDVFPVLEPSREDVLLEAEALSGSGFENVSISLRAGEVVAIAGLVGAGKTELLRTLFGEAKTKSGRILVKGEEVHISSPASAISRGIAYIPDDRKALGLVGELSLRRNATLAAISRFKRVGDLVDQEREREEVKQTFDALGLKYASDGQRPSTLSGGNQQKVVLAKWLIAQSRIFLMDEPTRGIDVGAKSEIYRLIAELTSRGNGVILVSPEIEEILGLAHRVFVMYEGRVVAEFVGQEINQPAIMRELLGAGD